MLSATVADVKRTLTLPLTPHLILLVYYIFNLLYQEEAARTLEFIHRRFIGINPERGTKVSRGKIISKRTRRVVPKKSVTVKPHISTLLKNLIDFEWNFI